MRGYTKVLYLCEHHTNRRSLFVVFDDDRNELVDALEFMSAICVISGMSQAQKIAFIFGVFDFDESGLLTVDEMILAFRSTISGLCKLSGLDLPPETEIERIAVGAFADARAIEGSTIDRVEFARYCATTPEVVSWMEFYADIREPARPASTSSDRVVERFVTALAALPVRSHQHQLATDLEGIPEAKITSEETVCGGDDGSAAIIAEPRPSPPWLASVAFLEPSDTAAEAYVTVPDEALELEWIHGFNAQRRQHVFYARRSQLVYPAGTVGVVLDTVASEQSFFGSHADLIEWLAVHHVARDTYVATGELGVQAKVRVCSAITF